VAPGVRLLDTPLFPAEWKEAAQAVAQSLQVYEMAPLDWTFISPPLHIEPGVRTGHFRMGENQLLKDSRGESHISMEDFAVAMLNEAGCVEKLKALILRSFLGSQKI